ncbi:MAG: S-adenosylmethionine decarboxylase [Rubripirellula sp.]|nr:S-adenosylmethionine decarboxylase [Rubripirellula sp.]
MTKLSSQLTIRDLGANPGPTELITGIEWMVEAFQCDVEGLCNLHLVRQICDQVVQDLGLKVIGDPQAHQFDEPNGVTMLYMLSESHLACHTYPEHELATFNLYCCRARPAWDWSTHLQHRLGAERVETRQFARGLQLNNSETQALESSAHMRSQEGMS